MVFRQHRHRWEVIGYRAEPCKQPVAQGSARTVEICRLCLAQRSNHRPLSRLNIPTLLAAVVTATLATASLLAPTVSALSSCTYSAATGEAANGYGAGDYRFAVTVNAPVQLNYVEFDSAGNHFVYQGGLSPENGWGGSGSTTAYDWFDSASGGTARLSTPLTFHVVTTTSTLPTDFSVQAYDTWSGGAAVCTVQSTGGSGGSGDTGGSSSTGSSSGTDGVTPRDAKLIGTGLAIFVGWKIIQAFKFKRDS